MTRVEFKAWCAERPDLDFDHLEAMIERRAQRVAERERRDMRRTIVRWVTDSERKTTDFP